MIDYKITKNRKNWNHQTRKGVICYKPSFTKLRSIPALSFVNQPISTSSRLQLGNYIFILKRSLSIP